MSVKRILILGAATMSMSAAIAGGFTQEPMAPTSIDSGIYLEGNLGYARQDYFDSIQWRRNTDVGINNNSNVYGGFSAGLDAGYQFNRNYALELGWFYLPSVNVAGSYEASQQLTSWALYLAGKYMVPLSAMNNTDLFFKLGVEYRNAQVPTAAINEDVDTITTGTSNFVRPMFATGLDYGFNDALSAVFQYAYFMGAANSFPFAAVNTGSLGTLAANVFTLGLGYKFAV